MDEGSKPNILLMGALAGVIALAGAQYYTVNNLHAVETKIAAVEADQAKAQDALAEELEKVRAASTGNAAEREKAISEVREQLEQARNQAQGIAGQVAGQVKKDTLKSVQELDKRIAMSEEKQREAQAQVANELTGLKEVADSAHTNIAAVSSEVKEVREEVANTRSQLNATVADLKRVTGDMGVLSGLIATNGKEIDALRQLGDRNYSEFTILKTKNAVRVGDVWVLLKSLDVGKNRYTIELRADDRKIEKKDRSINEPVQFFVGRNKQPHELVVNQIQKNAIVGYVAAPKVAAAR